MNLELKKFDLSNIKKDKVCVFIGKRETGKSFLVRDLLYYHQDIPVELLFQVRNQLIVFMVICFLVFSFMISLLLN